MHRHKCVLGAVLVWWGRYPAVTEREEGGREQEDERVSESIALRDRWYGIGLQPGHELNLSAPTHEFIVGLKNRTAEAEEQEEDEEGEGKEKPPKWMETENLVFFVVNL